MDGHTHVDVSLTVSCCDPGEVAVVAEKLARVLAALALDDHEAWLSVLRYADVDEEVGP